MVERRDILVAIDGFGPIHLDHLHGEYIGEINRAMVAEGLLSWGPHCGYRTTHAGKAVLGRPGECAFGALGKRRCKAACASRPGHAGPCFCAAHNMCADGQEKTK